MNKNRNPKLTGVAQALRRNMTTEEKHLWYDFLKNLPITVNRQKNIGNYILDFYIADKKIGIEIDGVQHVVEENRNRDEIRDANLRKLGITVLRYKNKDIHQNFATVCNDILAHLNIKASEIEK